MAEVVNRGLEILERAQAEVPNGELLDLYSIRPGVLLYGMSMAGDDYIRGPLFYEVNDALLHALHTMFQADTLGPSSLSRPPNHKDTTAFHFNSPLRVKEYTFDAKTLFYDARTKVRPACAAVGTSNFKVRYFHLLPDGKDRNQPTLAPSSLSTDALLANISEKRSSLVQVPTEGFYFCAPGKALRIEKSYAIDSAALWMYYVSLLKQGGDPASIRSKVFNRENGYRIAGAMIRDKQIPTTVGSLPQKIELAIQNGTSLTNLIPICSSVVLGSESCAAGIFFEKLWKRDVPKISAVYGKSTPLDKDRLLPKSYDHFLNVPNTLATATQWFYQEDFQPDAGRDNLAYNWNYNRYFDVNTIIFWLLLKMTLSPDGQPSVYGTSRKPALDRKVLDSQLSKIPHRFTEAEVTSLKLITLYDSMSEMRLELAVSSANPYGLLLKMDLLVDTPRTREVRARSWAFLEQLAQNWNNLLPVVPGPQNLLNQLNHELRTISFVGPEQTIQGLPVNWLLLPLLANFLRYLVGKAEFSFVAFA